MTIISIELLSSRVSTAVAACGTLERDEFEINLQRGVAKFVATQARTFAERHELLHQLPNVPLNGFSATVFNDRVSNRRVVAIRGTELDGLGQIIWDGLVTDGLGIGGAGFATA